MSWLAGSGAHPVGQSLAIFRPLLPGRQRNWFAPLLDSACAESCRPFDPAEDLFDSLACTLARRVSRPAGGTRAERLASWSPRILRNMRSDVERAATGREPRAVIAPVARDGDLACCTELTQHREPVLALCAACGLRQVYHDTITIFHQQPLGVAELGLFALYSFWPAALRDQWSTDGLYCGAARHGSARGIARTSGGVQSVGFSSFGCRLFSDAHASIKVPSTVKYSSLVNLSTRASETMVRKNSLARHA